MSVFKSRLQSLAAYCPPLEGRDPERHLLLDFNERTLEPAPHILKALHDFIESGRLHLYPSYGDLVARMAAYVGVDANQLMLCNGSDQGIELAFRSVCEQGDEVIIPAPSFAMYSQCAAVEGARVIEPLYSLERGYPLEEVLAAISDNTRLIVVSNPNNPCGTLLTADKVLEIAKAAPNALILVDECYFEYARESVVSHVAAYPNLLVTRTFSKTWGMPSLRMGAVIACAESIRTLLSVRGPYDVNQFAVVAAGAALDQPQLSLSYVEEVMQSAKPRLEACLQKLGVEFWPSAANYIWSFPERPQALQAHLEASGILVRPKADACGRMGLRITIGTDAQMQRLEKVLEAFYTA